MPSFDSQRKGGLKMQSVWTVSRNAICLAAIAVSPAWANWGALGQITQIEVEAGNQILVSLNVTSGQTMPCSNAAYSSTYLVVADSGGQVNRVALTQLLAAFLSGRSISLVNDNPTVCDAFKNLPVIGRIANF